LDATAVVLEFFFKIEGYVALFLSNSFTVVFVWDEEWSIDLVVCSTAGLWFAATMMTAMTNEGISLFQYRYESFTP
jgi:hypothetical protein